MIMGVSLRFNVPLSDRATWPALASGLQSSPFAGTK
jgi:hypothetical protein